MTTMTTAPTAPGTTYRKRSPGAMVALIIVGLVAGAVGMFIFKHITAPGEVRQDLNTTLRVDGSKDTSAPVNLYATEDGVAKIKLTVTPTGDSELAVARSLDTHLSLSPLSGTLVTGATKLGTGEIVVDYGWSDENKVVGSLDADLPPGSYSLCADGVDTGKVFVVHPVS